MSDPREDALTDLLVWAMRTRRMWRQRDDNARHPGPYREGVLDTIGDLLVLLQAMIDEEL